MNFKVDAHQGSNISVVYDKLDIAGISRDMLRSSMGQAAFMDTPDLLVVIVPPGIVIQIAERRIIVSDQTQNTPGVVDLASPTMVTTAAVSGGKTVAYGFNYDVSVILEGVTEAGTHLTSLLPIAKDLERSLEASNLTAIPRLNYIRNSVQYDLRFVPVEGPKLNAHLNAHFGGKPLPDQETLRQAFVLEFNEIGRVIGKL